MTHPIRTRADVEYSLMLAMLNFHNDVMRSTYSHIHVRFLEQAIEVELTRNAPIPEEEQLAQTQEGRTRLRQAHRTRFAAGQARLQHQLNDILGGHIGELRADLDPLTGTSTIVITIPEAGGSASRSAQPG